MRTCRTRWLALLLGVSITELAKALTAAQMATIDWMMPMYRY